MTDKIAEYTYRR